MIVASYNSNLIDYPELIDIMSRKGYATMGRDNTTLTIGWLDGMPIIRRCTLKQWQELESEHLHQ